MNTPDPIPVIRTEMIRWGYTVKTLSEESDISVAVLQNILRGRTKSLSTRTIFGLSRAFHYEIAEFIDLLHGITPQKTPI